MTSYVVPLTEYDLPLDQELQALTLYGINRQVLAWFVVDGLTNGNDHLVILDTMATEVFNAVEEHHYAITGDVLETKMNIDRDMTFAGVMLEHILQKLIPHIDFFLKRISQHEFSLHNRPIQFEANRPLGQDVIIETHMV